MSVMFAAAPSGSRPSNGNLFEFKAGIAKLQPGSTPDSRKVVAQNAKGVVFIKQTPDQLVHFCWKNRETGATDLDLIIFPGDTEFVKIKECTDARMFMLKFKNTSDERRLFWLQEPLKDKDEEVIKKVNDYLNNPPPQRTGARGGATERGNALLASLGGNGEEMGALGNMDQNQLMQLFSLMQSGNGSDMLPLQMRGIDKNGGSVDEPSSSADPLPGQVPVNPSSLGNPDLSTPIIPGKKHPRIKADQLRSIISSIPTPSGTAGGKLPTLSSGRGPQISLELTDVINRSNVSDVVAAHADRLLQHLPDQEPINKDERELKETINTPQFRKATSEFGHALQTGQMGPVLQQFQIPEEAVNAAQSGNVLEFAKKLTASEAGIKEEIDAQINAEAAAEETTESSLQEPSAKKGKTDDDDNKNNMSSLWKFFASLFHRQETDFQKYVSVVLDKEGYILSDVVEISIEETKFKQKFAHVIVSKEKDKYIVLLILDEFHRDKPIIKRQKNTPEGPVLEKATFPSEIEAKSHVQKKAALYRIGHFDVKECSFYRVVKCDPKCLEDPDSHILPGDYILRDLNGFNRASHAGVYVGRGKVIHYDDPDISASVVHCLTGKGGHVVHVAPLEKFVTHSTQEIRILVHCFQQRSIEEKLAAAEELAKVQYGQYEYGIFSNNCQHLASLVSCGRLEMVDQEIVDSIQKIALVALGMVLAGVAKSLYDYFFPRSDDDKKHAEST